jgi:hypothetical protein
MHHNELVACVLRAHAVLGCESDLSPCNPRINEALSSLVQGVMQGCPPGEEQRVLADPGVCAVRDALVGRLALAEGAMERYWAEAFCGRARLTVADLRTFAYWDCYHHLVQAELAGLEPHLGLDDGERIAFVGAGPLPLSAIIMRARTGLPVTCIDSDSEACDLARELCRKADLPGMEIECADGTHYDYGSHATVIIASLVPEKAQVMQRIGATRPGAVVALRSVEGLCTLLYDPVDEAEIEMLGCSYLGRTGHNPNTINTTLLYEAGSAEARVPRRPTNAAVPLDVTGAGAGEVAPAPQ